MVDRVPTYPGRVQLVPVSGQDNIYDLTLADEPVQVGTPLSKANLLTDETAANVYQATGSTPATPNWALALLAQKMAANNTDIETLKLAVGAPLVAATSSAMTDTTKIYVYTGSQSGYTYGNWYYYNGSAWTSGGVYNSTAVQTDKTLSVSGAAADAAVTGYKIADLTATSKNLLDPHAIVRAYTTMTVTVLGDSVIIASTSARTYHNGYVYVTLKPNTTYRMSLDAIYTSGTGRVMWGESTDGGSTYPSTLTTLFTSFTASGHKTATFTTGTDGHVIFRFYCTYSTSQSGSVTYSNIILTEGSATEDYIPYAYARDDAARLDITALQAKLPSPPSTSGTYRLTCTVSGGVATYSWEA